VCDAGEVKPSESAWPLPGARLGLKRLFIEALTSWDIGEKLVISLMQLNAVSKDYSVGQFEVDEGYERFNHPVGCVGEILDC
jgi:hypothetical protein